MSTSYREKIRNKLEDGEYEEWNSLSICCLNDFCTTRGGIKYQVHCEDSRYRFSRLYSNYNDAISKFLNIKHKLLRTKGDK
jgi:hypothetical protein